MMGSRLLVHPAASGQAFTPTPEVQSFRREHVKTTPKQTQTQNKPQKPENMKRANLKGGRERLWEMQIKG